MYRLFIVFLLAVFSWVNLAHAQPDKIPPLAKARANLLYPSNYSAIYDEEIDQIDGTRTLQAYSCADASGEPVTSANLNKRVACLGVSRFHGNNHEKNEVSIVLYFEHTHYPDCEKVCKFRYNYNGNTSKVGIWKAQSVNDSYGNFQGLYELTNASIATILSPNTKFIRFAIEHIGEQKVFTVRTDIIDLRRLLTPAERKKLKL